MKFIFFFKKNNNSITQQFEVKKKTNKNNNINIKCGNFFPHLLLMSRLLLFFQVQNNPTQIRVTAPGSPLDKILSQVPIFDISYVLMGFCPPRLSRIHHPRSCNQDQHLQFYASCKMGNYKPTMTRERKKIKLFL